MYRVQALDEVEVVIADLPADLLATFAEVRTALEVSPWTVGEPGDRDPAEAVLDEIHDRPDVERLVIGMRRRTPVGKALLGSVSQRLLLESPVPVLAVKPPA